MSFVFAFDADVAAAEVAFAIEQSRREHPFVGAFNLFEQFDGGAFGSFPDEPPVKLPLSLWKSSITRGFAGSRDQGSVLTN
jgi:hypothetical protein